MSQATMESAPLPALICEACGYRLEGLPASRCGTCAGMHLRCPECGHVQDADLQYGGVLKPLNRAHLAVRIVSELVRVGVLLPMLWLWGAVFAALAHDGPSELRHWLAVALFMGLYALPMRVALLRIRPMWLGSLVCTLLLWAAALVALSVVPNRWGTYSRHVGVAAVVMASASGWLLAAWLGQHAWRGWLKLIYPGGVAKEVYAWQTGRLHRRNASTDRMNEGLVGKEMRARCEHCGTQMEAQTPEWCACGMMTLPCPADGCGGRTRVSMARVAVEELYGRSGFMVLGLIAMVGAVAAGVLTFMGLICSYGAGQMWRYSWNQSATVMMLNALMPTVTVWGVFGVLAGLLLVRRTLALVGLLAGFIPLGVVGVMLVLLGSAHEPDGGGVLFALSAGATAYVLAYLLTRPLLGLAGRVLMPRQAREVVMGWLSSRMTLDEARMK